MSERLVDVDADELFAAAPAYTPRPRRSRAKAKFIYGRRCERCGGELGPLSGMCWPCHASRLREVGVTWL
jgi:uncharacterized OB-fold protein